MNPIDPSIAQADAADLTAKDPPPASILTTPHEEPIVGAAIGGYKLLHVIGEGGFGTVWVADQQYPVQRRVALKVIKLGMDTREVIARFEAERQALAMMDHPNIARVLDAGATPGGRPYFVMELVRGVPITQYCDMNRVSIRERLELFISVCQAVQHAHQKGIIHRDLKPSNVLVTLQDGRPIPKVIDFGIAKATDSRLTDKTLFTHAQRFIGTPLYTSPEQAESSALDIDTRSDIYTLGVLLYELLTGVTPHDPEQFHGRSQTEIRRILREVDPLPPSVRVAALPAEAAQDIAQARRTDPVSLARMLRRDLDWIVMMALDKDRTRRYDTANGLAMDLRRYLASEPVLAGPPSTRYRLRKFARRYRAPLAIIAVLAVALAAGTGISTIGFLRAVAAEAAAEKERDMARLAARSAQHAAAIAAEGLDIFVNRLIWEDLQRLGIDPDPRQEIYLDAIDRATPGSLELISPLNALAVLYCRSGRAHDARPLLERALDICDRVLEDNHPKTIRTRYNLASCLADIELYEEAEELWAETIAILRSALSLENHWVIGGFQIRYAESLAALGMTTRARHELVRAHENLSHELGQFHGLTEWAAIQLQFEALQALREVDPPPAN